MAELIKDETKRMLGRQRHVCKICGAEGDFKSYLAREMMQGKKEEFVYFACDSCQCLQIASVPDNLGDYYGEDYYSMQVQADPDMQFDKPVSHTMKVLDVGCGAGAWLLQKAAEGWENLYGCDPFLDKDRRYGSRVSIRSCSIHEMEGDGSFDVIRMGDSFERMADPLEVLKSVRRLLKPEGTLYMTIPTYPNTAFERYGPHWYQLDAPRHIFLYSRKSLEWLAREAGLMVSSVRYNSNADQFVRSYFYQRGVPYFEQTPELIGQYFSRKDFAELGREADACNEKECGDHMEVYWQRSPVAAAGEGKKVIFQRFPGKESRRQIPYPPVYREPDTDYICFTDDERVHSSAWKVKVVESLGEEDLEPYLEKYAIRWELKPDQIQMGPVSEASAAENIVRVPALEELPLVHFEPEKFVPTADEKGNYIYRKNPVCHNGKYNGRPLVLTIGVPVSNQIGTIDRCLSHIKPLLDGLDAELVVIDTGSTDGTVEVCRSYGARIVSRPWDDNMSGARNEGIYNARGEWYMSIDDDEWFEDVEDILQFFKKGTYRSYNTATYIQRNYKDSQGEVYEDYHTLRMARISPDLHFEGRIHDALVFHGRNRCYMLQSYAHHYGFVQDNPEKGKKKFLRNAGILLYDVHEYPEDLRYLFQLANEYRCIQHDMAINLFAQTIALSMEGDKQYRGRMSVVELLSTLYDMDDRRLFQWAEYLVPLFPLTVPDLAAIAWSQTSLAFRFRKPAEQVLQYYGRYRELLEQYREDPGVSQYLAFHGLAMLEHDFYVMDVEAIAFCSYLKVQEEEKALELLKIISLEVVKNRRIAVLLAGLMAGDAVYQAFCDKLTAMQWEEWSGEILKAFAVSLTKEWVYEQQLGRLSGILARISISSVLSWLEQFATEGGKAVREKLTEYALSCVEEGRIFEEGRPLQELAFCARVLKEVYAKGREGEERGRLLKAYILVEGIFAERYYRPELLQDGANTALRPEVRAACRMAAALRDGTASSENVALLKQALEIFPPFHQEVRGILAELLREKPQERENIMQIYVCCLPRVATGGIELLHQLVYELNRQCPGIARILYVDKEPEKGWQTHPQYLKYANPSMVNTVDAENAVIILPEIWPVLVDSTFREYPCVIWWESVDNYFHTTPQEVWYRFAENKAMLHMTQSVYARSFLIEKAGISEDRIIEVSDYLSEGFLAGEVKLEAYGRRPRVLYNPKKGMEFTSKLMEASPELEWTPIKGMPPEQVAALMAESRVYVDFGDHPGKDRMPREAVAGGCCIVTGRNGSAGYYEDVPISDVYKFEREEANIPAICARIKQLVDEYDEHIMDFAYYRNVIKGEKKKFEEAVGGLIPALWAYYSLDRAEKMCRMEEEAGSVIGVAVYGADGDSEAVKKVIEEQYNSQMLDLDENNCIFEVKCFITEEPYVLTPKELPVMKTEGFLKLYQEQKVAGIMFPAPVYKNQPLLVENLIRAGVDTADIYCVEI